MKRWIRQINSVTAAVVIATALLALFTLLIFFLPRLHFAYQSLELSTALESVSIVVSLGAFFLCFSRFRATSELRLLLLALAFLTLSLYSLVLEIVVPYIGDGWEATLDDLAYFLLISRFVAVILLLLSLAAGHRKVSFGKGWAALAAVLSSLALLALALFRYGTGPLPSLVSPGGWKPVSEAIPPEVFAGLSAFGIISHTVTGICFFAAGIGYLRLYQQEKRPFWGWLSISFVASFFTQLNFMVFASIYVGYIFPGDFLRLFSRLALLMGTYAEMAYAYRQSRYQNQELQALQDISILGMGRTDSGAVLAGITAIVRDVFGAEVVVMLFHDRRRSELAARWPAIGLSESQVAGLNLPLSQDCLAVTSYKSGVTMAYDGGDQNAISPTLEKLLPIRSALVSPLKTANQTLGVLLVINKKRGWFEEQEARFLKIIAGRAAMIIENANLHEQLEAAAVIEERMRLAREIHDGLAQNLGYLNLKLPQVLIDVSEDREKALDELKSMRRIVQESLTETRQAIVDLQTGGDADNNFLKMVREYVSEFSEAAQLDIKIRSQNGDIRVNPSIRKELIRIVQEALNNVRRHADARRVELTFATLDGKLHMEIIDDGKGFSADQFRQQRGWGHFGIQCMKDRAANLGGNLRIESPPSGGTAVLLDVPLQEGGSWTD